MSVGLLNGLQNGGERGLSPGLGGGMDAGLYDGLYGELGKRQYLLNLYPNAAIALSLRRLTDKYKGFAIRVRRSSDNAEQDIGFDINGELDLGLLRFFVGGGSGFVTTWYDQSGNGRNATQTTNANQPRIVNSGTVDTESGKPTVLFADSTDQMTHPYIISQLNDIYYAFKSTNSIYNFHNTANVGVYGYFVQNGSSSTTLSSNYGTPTLFINGQQFIGTTRNDLFVSYGGAFRLSSVINADLSNSNWSTIRISGYTAIAATLLGGVSEYIIYSKTQTDRLGIENNINQYYKIY